MAVAKSYEHYNLGEPFEDKGRMYVRATCKCSRCGGSGMFATFGTCFKCNGSGKEVETVRWYTDAEREQMDKRNAAAAEKRLVAALARANYRKGPEYNGFGDSEGYITLLLGDTYPIKDELKANGCRYSAAYGWYIPRDVEYTNDSVKTLRLDWTTVSENDEILAEPVIKKIVTEMTREPSYSEYVGEIGQKITVQVKVMKNRAFCSRFGESHIHTFEDENKNVYVWSTAAKSLDEGSTLTLTGTIKDHSEYNGVKQTVLTRCKVA